MSITARQLVSRHPSQYPEAHGPSVPRSGPLTFKPSRLTSVPASGPPGPQPSESQRARGGHPTPASRAFAPRSPKRTPLRHSVRLGTDPDPGPRLRHWGLRHWPTRACRATSLWSRIDCAPVSRRATGFAWPSCKGGATPLASRASQRGRAASQQRSKRA
jgi:hypothetical protein